MSKSRVLFLLALLTLATGFTTACNTVEGAGRDLAAAGDEVSETADEVGDRISDDD